MRSKLNKFEHFQGVGPWSCTWAGAGTLYMDLPYGSYTLHGTGTTNVIGTGMDTMENNGYLSLFLSLCSVYST